VRTQFTAAGGKRHLNWAKGRLNKKRKQLSRITTDIETLECTREQVLEDTEPQFTAQVGRIIDMQKQLAELEKAKIEKEVGQRSDKLAEVQLSLKVPLSNYLYSPRGTGSWSKDNRPPAHREISVEDIQARFHLNKSQAAADMGFKCVSSFNDACKRFSVQNWQRQGASKNHWTKEEDKKVVDGVARWGVKAWAVISQELQGRDRCDVRARWMNSLDPALKKGGWTAEEDKLLGDLHSAHGRSWTTIAALLGGRAPNHVKSHWDHLEAVKATCEREETMQGGLFSRLVDVPSKCVPKPKVAQPNFQDASGNSANLFGELGQYPGTSNVFSPATSDNVDSKTPQELADQFEV